MPNTFNPAEYAELGIELVRAELVLGALVGRHAEAHFKAGRGASVNVRRPVVLRANQRTVGTTEEITPSEITETFDTVAISEQAYTAVDLTDADLTLNMADFGRQVLAPQAAAVAEHIEEKLATTLAAAPAAQAAYDAANPVKTLTAIRKEMRDRKAPQAGLVAVAGTLVYADLLDSGALDHDKAGDAHALRNAQVGMVRGLQVVESVHVPEEGLFVFHRDAVQLVLAAPAAPKGAAHAASLAQDGFAMTWIMDYDAKTLQDRSVVSTFIGAKLLQTTDQETSTLALKVIAE